MQSPHIARSRVLVLLAVLVAGLILLLASAVTADSEPRALVERRVSVGDTLWSIAADVAGPEQDVRAVVHEIGVVNQVDPGDLRDGDVLLIPAG